MTDYLRFCGIIYELKQKCIHGYKYDTSERCGGCPHYVEIKVWDSMGPEQITVEEY